MRKNKTVMVSAETHAQLVQIAAQMGANVRRIVTIGEAIGILLILAGDFPDHVQTLVRKNYLR